MNVSLTPEMERMIQEKVSSGRYNSASEVVREALQLLLERDLVHNHRLQELRSELAKGIAAADRGELLDGEEVMARLSQRHEEYVKAGDVPLEPQPHGP